MPVSAKLMAFMQLGLSPADDRPRSTSDFPLIDGGPEGFEVSRARGLSGQNFLEVFFQQHEGTWYGCDGQNTFPLRNDNYYAKGHTKVQNEWVSFGTDDFLNIRLLLANWHAEKARHDYLWYAASCELMERDDGTMLVWAPQLVNEDADY